jgi:hypothetical protein
MSTKTFTAYLDSHEEAVDPKFSARIISSKETITSLTGLTRWSRQRYPDHFHADVRKDIGMPYGAAAMRTLWAGYLEWLEDTE